MRKTYQITEYGSFISGKQVDGYSTLPEKTFEQLENFVLSNRNKETDALELLSLSAKKGLGKETNREIQVLSIKEQKLLRDYLVTDLDKTKFGILLCLYTGIRIGELCALRWEHLNLDQGVLSIQETMQRVKNVSNAGSSKTHITITTPKSKCSIRDIPLPSFLIELAKSVESSPKAFILTGSKTKFIEPRTLQNRFKKITLECNIRGVNYHALRHTFATRCIEVGFEIKSLSEILGHANVNITLNRYVHSSFKLKQENMNKFCTAVN